MNHSNSGLAYGTSGSPQLNVENGEAENKAAENEAKAMGFNSAGSKSVKKVVCVIKIYDAHSMPSTSSANSVVQNIVNGKITTERYYNDRGYPYLDIDYTDHGNPKMHSIVPHEHSIDFLNGKFKREKVGRRINK